MAAPLNVRRIKNLALMSKDFHKDPARIKPLEDREIAQLTDLWEALKRELEQVFQEATAGKLYAAAPGFDLEGFDAHVEEAIRARIIDPAHDIFTGGDAKAYRNGREFAQGFFTVELGDTPEARRKEWSAIERLVKKNDMDMARIGDRTQSEIRRVIGEGIKGEQDQKTIQAAIMGRVDAVGVTRSETMVRSETQRAVNAGVKNTYEEAGVTEYERLEALDEKTCTEWEFNIGGRVYMGCVAINGQHFTREEADQVDEQTHPNCRGTWIPVVEIPTMEAPEAPPEAPTAPPTETAPAPAPPPGPAPGPLPEAPLEEPEPPERHVMTRDEVLAAWEDVHGTHNYESALVLNKEGYTVIAKRGQKHQVALEYGESAKITAIPGGGYFIHNHPSGHAFSLPDYAVARSTDLQEMRVIGNVINGQQFRYVLTKGANGWEPSEVVGHYFKQFHKEIMDDNLKQIDAGALSIADAETSHYHDVWTKVAEATGINYRRERLK